MPVRGIAVGGRTGFGMAAALEDRSGRSWRYLPKHAGQVPVSYTHLTLPTN